jgi:hypothetical protein
VRELVDSIFLAADSRAEKRAQDRHMVIDSGRAGAAMLVYLAPNLADDAVVGKILWDDSAQASAAATMAAFRGIVEAHHVKYFGEAKTDPMYLKLIPVSPAAMAIASPRTRKASLLGFLA